MGSIGPNSSYRSIEAGLCIVERSTNKIMHPDPHWTAYVTALFTPVVAVLGAAIAYRQWQLAQNKLKLDLFDRRFKVYEAARNLLASIMRTGSVEDQELSKYFLATREAKWLFGPEVAEYLDKPLFKKASELLVLADELEGVPVGEIRTKNVQSQREIKDWLLAQHDILDRCFSPYLQLRH